MQRFPMTPQGFEKLQADLKHLISVERPRCIQALSEARAHGDLSENAEYDAAKHAQSLLEGRIKDWEARVSLAEVIDPKKYIGSERIVFGATVTLEGVDDGKQVVYQIVGETEADIKEGRISVTSPIARAMIGKQDGDTVTVVSPGGKRDYDIVKVAYS